MGYDWLSAPTLPIIGGMVSGLWRGAKNTDWFDCKNWDDAKVPDAATDVTITEEATNDCTIGILGAQPAGTDGVCASLALSSASATVWNLAVVNGSALTIGGPLTINHSSGANQLKATVGLGSVLTADAVSITGNTSIGNEAAVRCDSMGSTLNVSGDLAIGTGGLLDLEGVDASNSGVLNLGGNYSNAGDESHFLDNFSLVTFNGGSDQTVDIGNAPEFFYDLKVDKPSNEVVLNGSIQIRHMLNLTQGIVLDTLVGVVQPLVTLEANATVVNTNHSSYVNGPVQKFGGADFTFPVGEAGYYRPCRLEDNTAGSTDAFTAEYFQEDPTTSISNMIAPSLDHISTRGYWDITSSDVSLNARVFLSWYPPASGEVTLGALGDLRVAHWNSINSIWDDRGNGGTTGTPGGGMIRTAAVETAFSPWTLASTTANNPLPIELLSFTAVPRNGVVELAWSTASEQDNDHFTVERSADAQYFDELLRQPGAGNSQQVLHYAATDNAPLAGHSYYRLRQTDYNGSSVVSEMVPVLLQGGADLTVLDDGGTPWLRHFFPTGSVLEIRDGTGRTVAQGIIQNSGLLALPVDGLAHGVYVLRVSDGLRVASTRFVY